MECVEAKKGQGCQACKQPFKAGKLVLEDSTGALFCIEGCFTKPDGTRPKPNLYDVKAAPAKPKKKYTPVVAPTPKDRTNDLTYDPMSDKLRNDINKMARRQ